MAKIFNPHAPAPEYQTALDLDIEEAKRKARNKKLAIIALAEQMYIHSSTLAYSAITQAAEFIEKAEEFMADD